jgi:hypothetical protein
MFGQMASGAPRGAQSLNQSSDRQATLGRKYQAFSNPFFDLASTYTPPTIKALFAYCRHYHLTHGVINAIITKASEYPVTDLILSHKDRPVKDRWSELFHGVLNYRVHQFEVNLEYFVYGNAFVSPSLPFTKVLQCRRCNADHNALRLRSNWRYSAQGFWLSCTRCGQTDYAIARDDYYPRLSDMSLVRWNPELVNTFYNEATGRTDYTLDFSAEFKNGITLGRKDLVATTPQAILEAVKTQKTLVFDSNAVFHMRRPGLSGMARWGIPLMMPVLKDALFMQIMKKAQEAVLLTHLVPQVFLFPQPATSGADPFTSTSLADWRDHIRRELARQRVDPAYYGILPFPLGHQTIGENGKSLLLMPEIQSMAEHICIGMGFPVDLIFGNGTYAGSSVNMRMLENFFMSNMHGHLRMVHWVMKHFGSFLNWPTPDARFKAFRMADDVQRSALLLQMMQLDAVSETTVLSQVDLKVEDETQLRMSEMIIKMEASKKKAELMAEVQGQGMIIAAKYQAQAQGAAQAAAQRDAAARKSPFEVAQGSDVARPPGITLDAAAAALAEALKTMPEERRAAYMVQLRGSLPELEQMVQQQQGAGLPGMPENDNGAVQAGGGADPAAAAAQGAEAKAPGAGQVDMRPAPNALPPRRAGGA